MNMPPPSQLPKVFSEPFRVRNCCVDLASRVGPRWFLNTSALSFFREFVPEADLSSGGYRTKVLLLYLTMYGDVSVVGN